MLQVDRLLETAFRCEASDLFLAVGRPPTLRLHGRLRELQTTILSPDDTFALGKSIARPKNWQQYERDHYARFALSYGDQCRFRVIMYQQKGVCGISLHRVPTQAMAIDELALPEGTSQVFDAQRGLLLVTGRSGSGTTTTLAAITDHLNENRDRYIVTIEAPIEYCYTDKKSIIAQCEVGEDVPSTAAGIQHAAHLGADVLVVGELYDRDAILAALEAVEAGHLVFAAMPVCNAALSLTRTLSCLHDDPRPQDRRRLADAIVGILTQQCCPKKDGEGFLRAFTFSDAREIRDMLCGDKATDC